MAVQRRGTGMSALSPTSQPPRRHTDVPLSPLQRRVASPGVQGIASSTGAQKSDGAQEGVEHPHLTHARVHDGERDVAFRELVPVRYEEDQIPSFQFIQNFFVNHPHQSYVFFCIFAGLNSHKLLTRTILMVSNKPKKNCPYTKPVCGVFLVKCSDVILGSGVVEPIVEDEIDYDD